MLMKQKLKQFYKKHKKVIIPGAFTLVIAGMVAAVTVYALRNDLVSRTKPASNTKPVSATVASPLTGREIKSELAERPVTGVMIENSPEARPQSVCVPRKARWWQRTPATVPVPTYMPEITSSIRMS